MYGICTGPYGAYAGVYGVCAGMHGVVTDQGPWFVPWSVWGLLRTSRPDFEGRCLRIPMDDFFELF